MKKQISIMEALPATNSNTPTCVANTYFTLMNIGQACLMPFLTLYLKHIGLSSAQVGVLQATYSLVFMCGWIGWTWLAIRFNRQHLTIILSTVLSILVYSVLSITPPPSSSAYITRCSSAWKSSVDMPQQKKQSEPVAFLGDTMQSIAQAKHAMDSTRNTAGLFTVSSLQTLKLELMHKIVKKNRPLTMSTVEDYASALNAAGLSQIFNSRVYLGAHLFPEANTGDSDLENDESPMLFLKHRSPIVKNIADGGYDSNLNGYEKLMRSANYAGDTQLKEETLSQKDVSDNDKVKITDRIQDINAANKQNLEDKKNQQQQQQQQELMNSDYYKMMSKYYQPVYETEYKPSKYANADYYYKQKLRHKRDAKESLHANSKILYRSKSVKIQNKQYQMHVQNKAKLHKKFLLHKLHKRNSRRLFQPNVKQETQNTNQNEQKSFYQGEESKKKIFPRRYHQRLNSFPAFAYPKVNMQKSIFPYRLYGNLINPLHEKVMWNNRGQLIRSQAEVVVQNQSAKELQEITTTTSAIVDQQHVVVRKLEKLDLKDINIATNTTITTRNLSQELKQRGMAKDRAILNQNGSVLGNVLVPNIESNSVVMFLVIYIILALSGVFASPALAIASDQWYRYLDAMDETEKFEAYRPCSLVLSAITTLSLGILIGSSSCRIWPSIDIFPLHVAAFAATSSVALLLLYCFPETKKKLVHISTPLQYVKGIMGMMKTINTSITLLTLVQSSMWYASVSDFILWTVEDLGGDGYHVGIVVTIGLLSQAAAPKITINLLKRMKLEKSLLLYNSLLGLQLIYFSLVWNPGAVFFGQVLTGCFAGIKRLSFNAIMNQTHPGLNQQVKTTVDVVLCSIGSSMGSILAGLMYGTSHSAGSAMYRIEGILCTAVSVILFFLYMFVPFKNEQVYERVVMHKNPIDRAASLSVVESDMDEDWLEDILKKNARTSSSFSIESPDIEAMSKN